MKPIIFSTENVKALLDGRKTMVRMPIKPQPAVMVNRKPLDGYNDDMIKADGDFPTPQYHPGDVLWVREPWNNMCHGCEDCSHTGYQYKADGQPASCIYDKAWCSPIFMPRQAARLFLRVKDVRVEKNEDSGQWEWAYEFERAKSGAIGPETDGTAPNGDKGAEQ